MTAPTIEYQVDSLGRSNRYLGRCRDCRTVNVHHADTTSGLYEQWIDCRECGNTVKVKQLWATENPSKRCTRRCENATRNDCECHCGGRNHGRGHEGI